MEKTNWNVTATILLALAAVLIVRADHALAIAPNTSREIPSSSKRSVLARDAATRSITAAAWRPSSARADLRRLPPPEDDRFNVPAASQNHGFADAARARTLPHPPTRGALATFPNSQADFDAGRIVRGQHGCYNDCDGNCHWVGLLGSCDGPGGRPVSFSLYEWIADHPVLSYTAITAAIVVPIIVSENDD